MLHYFTIEQSYLKLQAKMKFHMYNYASYERVYYN